MSLKKNKATKVKIIAKIRELDPNNKLHVLWNTDRISLLKMLKKLKEKEHDEKN